jgi:hypothetical protein
MLPASAMLASSLDTTTTQLAFNGAVSGASSDNCVSGFTAPAPVAKLVVATNRPPCIGMATASAKTRSKTPRLLSDSTKPPATNWKSAMLPTHLGSESPPGATTARSNTASTRAGHVLPP